MCSRRMHLYGAILHSLNSLIQCTSREHCKAPGELVGGGLMHVLAKKWLVDISLKCIFFLDWFSHIHILKTGVNYRT